MTADDPSAPADPARSSGASAAGPRRPGSGKDQAPRPAGTKRSSEAEAKAPASSRNGGSRTAPPPRRRRPPAKPSGFGVVTAWVQRLVRPTGRLSGPPKPMHDKRLERVLLAVAVAVPLLVGALAAASGWRATGDNALIGVRVGDLLSGHLLTSGLPTTGENFGSGITSNHPGPLPFYLLGPFQAVYGIDAGLALGAAAINAAAWGIAVWVMTRRHGLVAGTATLAVYGTLAFGLGAHVLYDPVSSNIAAFASITMVIVAAAVIGGDWKLLPIFTLVGSFVIQAHLTYVALGMPLVVAVVGAVVVGLILHRGPPVASLVWSGAIGLVVWAPVLWDQFFGTGNITNIIRTFSNGNAAGKGLGFAAGRLVHALAPLPMFARPTGDLGNLGFLDSAGLVRTLLAMVVVGAFGWALYRHVTARSAYLPLTVLVAVVMLASIYSASKLPPPSTVKAANLRWMWTGGALVWLVVLLALLELAGMRRRAPDLLALVACLAAIAVVAGVSSYWTVDVRDQPSFSAVDSLRSQLSDKLEDGTFIVKYQGAEALLELGPPVVADLIDRGYDLRVSLGPFDRAYGDHIVTKTLPKDTPAIFITTAREGSSELAELEASRSNDARLAEASWDPGDGQGRIVARVYLAELAAACKRIASLGAELAAPDPDRPPAEVLGDLSDLATARLSTIAPLLTKRQEQDLQTLVDQVGVWQAQVESNPDAPLAELVLEDLAALEGGVEVLTQLCQ